MAYRPDDPYNTGLRNINQGQNMQMAELTDKQKNFIDKKNFPLQEGLISPQSVFETITNPALGVYDKGIFGVGAQEPTTKDEYNEYLKSIGISGQVSSLDDEEPYDFSGIQGQTAFLDPISAAKGLMAVGTKMIPKELLWLYKKESQINAGKKALKLFKKKKKTSTITGGDKKIINKKYTPPSHQTGGSGGVHSGMKTTKKKYTPPSHQTGGAGGVHSGMKTTPSRRHTGHGKSGRGRDPDRWKADGGLIKLFKYGGFLG